MFLLAKLKGWLALAGGIVLLVAGAFLRGWLKGAAAVKAKATEKRLKAIKARKEIEDEIDGLGHADLDERFKRWLSDNKRR